MAAPASNKPVSASSYQIARPRGQCALTGQPIVPGEAFMTALRQTPQGYERLDISMDAWQGFDTCDVVGFWQMVMPVGEQKKRPFVDDETLIDLFVRLEEASEPSRLNFRFVLGLLLLRKRLLSYESTVHRGDVELWMVRFRGRQELMELESPGLDESQIEQVSQQLSSILNEEL